MSNDQPSPDQQTLLIEGMRCAGCVRSVENALRAVAGVTAVSVNLATQTASIAGNAETNALIKAVVNAGFQASQPTEDEDSSEPEALASLANAETSQFRQLRLKFWFALAVALPALVAGFPSMLGIGTTSTWLHWSAPVLAVLTLAVMIYSGSQFFQGAWKALCHRYSTMDTLIAISMSAAWIYSALAAFAPQFFPSGTAQPFWDTIPVVIGLVVFGQSLEMRARARTSDAVKKLMGLKPKTVCAIRKGQEIELPLAKIRLGEILRIKPGEKIAVDGQVMEGHSSVDESMLSGEAIPVEKAPNCEVTSGTINLSGSFLYRATRIGKDTTLSRIIAAVQHAQGAKPEIGRLADQVAAYFVPTVILISVFTFFIWLNFGPEPRLNHAMMATVCVLVISCPCAIGLATPISVMMGVGKAADHGILIRNGNALQQAGRLTLLALDKTGTITMGKPVVTQIIPTMGWDENTLLQLAASLETGAAHPMAAAVLNAAKQRNLGLDITEDFLSLHGMGVQGKVNGNMLHFGNLAFIHKNRVDCADLEIQATELAEKANTPMFLAVNQQLAGIITITDPIKAEATAAIAGLHAMGLKTVMLTGGNPLTASAIAKQVGIEKVYAEVLPQGKAKIIEELKKQGEMIGMVGDGINDAIALTIADVGFAIGTGADIAIESADITLMHGSLENIQKAIQLSRATLKNIKQNLFAAFIYNMIGIPVAAGVFYSAFGLLLNPMIAGAAMAFSSVSVVWNASRLRKA